MEWLVFIYHAAAYISRYVWNKNLLLCEVILNLCFFNELLGENIGAGLG